MYMFIWECSDSRRGPSAGGNAQGTGTAGSGGLPHDSCFMGPCHSPLNEEVGLQRTHVSFSFLLMSAHAIMTSPNTLDVLLLNFHKGPSV